MSNEPPCPAARNEEGGAFALDTPSQRCGRRCRSVAINTAPSVRKIERSETWALRVKTKTQLERALDWSDGIVDHILAGTANLDTARVV
jgi:hypothetical protein